MTAAIERVICPADQLAARPAARIISAAGDAIRARGRFTLALSGGSTPEKTYGLLASPERSTKLDWSRIFLFFGDDRFVPHDDVPTPVPDWKRAEWATDALPEGDPARTP